MLSDRSSFLASFQSKHLMAGVFLACSMAFLMPLQAHAQSNPETSAYRTLEYQVINQIHRLRNSARISVLKYDDAASAVARQHAEAMAEQGVFSLTLPDLGSLNDQLNYARVSARPLHTFIVLGKTSREIFNQIQKLPALKDADANAIGLGLGQGEHPQVGNTYWAVVILLDRMVEMNLPREVAVGQRLNISVKYQPPYTHPRLPVTAPSGAVQRIQPIRQRGREAVFNVHFREKGRYAVEVLLDKPGLGPRVARILPVYAGEPYPRRESEQQSAPKQFKDTRSAAAYLLTLLNQERKKMGLSALQLDPILENTAIAHSKDMALRQFFAHTNPDGQNPNARYQLRGGFGTVGENIVVESQIEAAHRQLMSSPGHRANILRADSTHVGIGVYYAKGQYYIAQVFQSRPPSQDIRLLKERLGNWLDSYRADQRLGILLQDDRLQRVNQDYTLQMAQKDHLDYQGTRSLGALYMEQGGHYQQMNTIVLTARNFEDITRKLEKYARLLADERWERYGLGIVQANSKTQGHNLLWVTLGLARD